MTSPKVVNCPACNNVGLLEFGRDVQYCLCPIGRAKKEAWFELAPEFRDPEEAISRTLPDLEDLKGVA